ncbi:uncharacterized protein LOC122093526 [Macadamia integrifolia]|uniref:uncharacterized protein LOC122093526 n=1 Tax=Macadamia integrifolia TaxID=60698 RepID=UPI001C52A7FE|nr:uncharacterized protein LOC122093526 [Macadamia integrifolia]
MCSSKAKTCPPAVDVNPVVDGRPVLQPTCNRVPTLEQCNSLIKKVSPKSPPPPPPPLPSSATLTTTTSTIRRTRIAKASSSSSSSPPISPNSKSPRPPALKRGNDPNGLNSSVDKASTTPPSASKPPTLERKKSKKFSAVGAVAPPSSIESASSLSNYPSSLLIEAPGSIAAARREQVTLQQAQRKMKIAHYGRSKSAKFEGKVGNFDSSPNTATTAREEKRCSFITPNSDPLYVVYHDEEWGVPVHDDKFLFELLVLSGAQVGTDWTSILKKRQDFRDAFAGFDAETVANFTQGQMTSITADYGIDLSRVRGVVDNANRILEVRRDFGSLDKYFWGFINHKPIATQYKSCLKIPVKTSKSESISKDMVRRGFRSVGSTVIHSFMQAAGLTNDHLITCPRHLQCTALASNRATVAPAL